MTFQTKSQEEIKASKPKPQKQIIAELEAKLIAEQEERLKQQAKLDKMYEFHKPAIEAEEARLEREREEREAEEEREWASYIRSADDGLKNYLACHFYPSGEARHLSAKAYMEEQYPDIDVSDRDWDVEVDPETELFKAFEYIKKICRRQSYGGGYDDLHLRDQSVMNQRNQVLREIKDIAMAMSIEDEQNSRVETEAAYAEAGSILM